MSWLMVGIRRLHSKLRFAPIAPLTRINPRKTKPRHPLPGAERRLALAEDREVARSCTDDLTFPKSEAAFELPSSRRHAAAGELRKYLLSKAYGAWQAVPTGEAHRLPKSARYVSALPPQVKHK
jgi:hypothetical protein